MSSILDLARSLAGRGDVQEARQLLEREGAVETPEALFLLATWFDAGHGISKDSAKARTLFERAADAGHAQADVIFTNFLGSGTGGPRDWPAAVDRLRRRAERDSRARFEVDLINRMALTADGDPAQPLTAQMLSEAPVIRLHPGLLSEAECAYLTVAATPFLQPATVIDNASGKAVRNPIRTAEAAILTPPLESLVVQAINRRLAAITATDPLQGEPLQVLRYNAGQEYRTHIDAIPSLDNQRVWTALVYLNDGYEGGETEFVHAGGVVRGRTGTALTFRNVDAEGRADKRTAHCGRPVTGGTKLLASRWIRERPFTLPEAPAAG